MSVIEFNLRAFFWAQKLNSILRHLPLSLNALALPWFCVGRLMLILDGLSAILAFIVGHCWFFMFRWNTVARSLMLCQMVCRRFKSTKWTALGEPNTVMHFQNVCVTFTDCPKCPTASDANVGHISITATIVLLGHFMFFRFCPYFYRLSVSFDGALWLDRKLKLVLNSGAMTMCVVFSLKCSHNYSVHL